MQAPMDPVYEEIREQYEERELKYVVELEGRIGWGVVKLAVATNLEKEKRRREESHDGQSSHSLLHFQPDLMFEIFGVREGRMVEYVEVGEGGAEEIDHESKEPGKSVPRTFDGEQWMIIRHTKLLSRV